MSAAKPDPVAPAMGLDDLDAVLIGFPKTGTTSLAAWLDRSPDVIVSDPKETFALCPEFSVNHVRAGSPTLARAFEGAAAPGSGARAPLRVEASTLNVYSDTLRARMIDSSVRAIVMVRDHARAVESWHEQMVYAGDSPDVPLRKAWLAGSGARQGASGQRLKSDYRLMFRQGWWIERWIRSLGHDRVLVVRTDELADHAALAARLSGFLGVALSDLGPVRKDNARLKRSARWLRHLKGPVVRRAVAAVDRSGRLESGLRERVRRFYAAPATDTGRVDAALRADITEHFADDAARLDAVTIDNRAAHGG